MKNFKDLEAVMFSKIQCFLNIPSAWQNISKQLPTSKFTLHQRNSFPQVQIGSVQAECSRSAAKRAEGKTGPKASSHHTPARPSVGTMREFQAGVFSERPSLIRAADQPASALRRLVATRPGPVTRPARWSPVRCPSAAAAAATTAATVRRRRATPRSRRPPPAQRALRRAAAAR